MTPQEIFNKAYRGVIEQGGPAYYNGSCFYRGQDAYDNEMRCALGHVMKGVIAEDNHDLWDLEGSADDMCDSLARIEESDNCLNSNEAALLDILAHNRALCMDIQGAHDSAAELAHSGMRGHEYQDDPEAYIAEEFLTEYRVQMGTVAKVHGLKLPS